MEFCYNTILQKINYNLPTDIITHIMSYNGYYSRNGMYMKKIDISKYEKIAKMFLLRNKYGLLDNIYIEIYTPIDNGISFVKKVLTINYGMRPIHHPEYQAVDNNSIMINPFDSSFDAVNKLKIANKTIFYSFITYDMFISMDNNENNGFETMYLSTSNSMVYIPYEKKKFSYYTNYPYDVVSIDSNNENNKYYDSDQAYDQYNTDENYRIYN